MTNTITLTLPSGHVEHLTPDEWAALGMTVTLKLPSGHNETITGDAWRSLRGSANRQQPGSGRARQADRCACGAYTKHTAHLRKHVCKTGAKV